MLLRQLNDHIPYIFAGTPDRRIPFRQFARSILSELDWLRDNDTSKLEIGPLFPRTLLFAFRPKRRMEILNSGPTMTDWYYVAAVRIAETITGGHPSEHPLLKEGSGPAKFAAGILSGQESDWVLLSAPLLFRGIPVEHFIASGSTSSVYRVIFENRPCTLKLPRPGRLEQFRAEIDYLRQLEHDNLPELLAFSPNGDYCILEHLNTGKPHVAGRQSAGFLDALKYLHSKNILHGDIRFANMGVKANGIAALFDFSHARCATTRAETECEIRKLELLFATGDYRI